MHEQSIAWMIGGGTRTQTREEAILSIHRVAIAEAQASRDAETRGLGSWRTAVTSLFGRPATGTDTAPSLDCCAA